MLCFRNLAVLTLQFIPSRLRLDSRWKRAADAEVRRHDRGSVTYFNQANGAVPPVSSAALTPARAGVAITRKVRRGDANQVALAKQPLSPTFDRHAIQMRPPSASEIFQDLTLRAQHRRPERILPGTALSKRVCVRRLTSDEERNGRVFPAQQ